MKLIILMGISGSGKTTFRQRYVEKFPDFVTINMDEIRSSLGDVDFQFFNSQVARIAHNRLTRCFQKNKNVIWDNTTLSPKYLKQVFSEMPSSYEMELYATERSFLPDECIKSVRAQIENNEDRSDVPSEVIRKQAQRFKNLVSWIEHNLDYRINWIKKF